MIEGPRPEQQKNRSNILKAGLVAAQFLSPFAHSNIEAAEIPSTATWEAGVSELRRSVMEEPVEYAATGAILHTGTMAWPHAIRGNERGVNAIIGNVLLELRTLAENKVITKYCDIHTHSEVSIAKELGIPSGSGAYAPPSTLDAQTAAGRQALLPLSASIRNVQIESVISAVFDPRGVWYYRLLNDSEQKRYSTINNPFERQEQVSFTREIQRPFMQASVMPEFNFKVEYEKLRFAYRQRVGTEVRFVSYEELSSEPPCAGPDYKSVK